LLEISLVLFVMSLLVGTCIYSFAGLTAEQEIRRPATEFQRMTMEAVRRAALHEKPQVIVFEPRGFAIRYRTDPDGSASPADQQAWVRRVTLPQGMKMSLRRWGQERMQPAAGQRLVVAPGGLCEPLTARFELGSSWFELTLDPLSGGMAEEAMSLSASPSP
jgi:hypothetical protein